MALIGPNGAGKSTILKSMIRQLTLIGGKVILDGTDMERISYQELAKKMAVVLTARPRPELMTCRDVVSMGRYPYTGRMGILREQDEECVEKAMDMVRITDIAGRDFAAISDGQRQRVLLARAICQEPEILVLDEPTSYLDIRYQLEIIEVLMRLAEEKKMTILMSLHEIDLARQCADRIVCVKGDRIYAAGTPEGIFRNELIQDLYDLREGSYDASTGSIKLLKPVYS